MLAKMPQISVLALCWLTWHSSIYRGPQSWTKPKTLNIFTTSSMKDPCACRPQTKTAKEDARAKKEDPRWIGSSRLAKLGILRSSEHNNHCHLAASSVLSAPGRRPKADTVEARLHHLGDDGRFHAPFGGQGARAKTTCSVRSSLLRP